VGVGEGFVRSVLEVATGRALADDTGYRAAMAHVDASNAGQLYVSVDRLVPVVEPLIPLDQAETWRVEIRPYLDPIAGIAVSVTMEGGMTHTRFVVIVE
jgi:hypothetical protein